VQFPGFNDLNKTEQRVLALTMELYRPKEVANVLGVSTQYVRNVKTRLKLKLNLPDNWGA
jgi:DNA-binding CsgD family transcriptional regulator